jgi:hypothetical protein
MEKLFGLFAILVCLVLVAGCGLATKQEWSENYALMEGVRATNPAMIDGNPKTMGETAFPEGSQGYAGVSASSEAIITLPEKRFIRRIVIHSENLKEFDVFADKGNNDWRVIKEVKSVESSPIDLTVTAPFPTDRIRVRVLATEDDAEVRRSQRARSGGFNRFEANRRAPGKISEIELYGYKTGEETTQEKMEEQRESELDELLKLDE